MKAGSGLMHPATVAFAGMDAVASESREAREGDDQNEALLPELENKWQTHEVPTPDRTS